MADTKAGYERILDEIRRADPKADSCAAIAERVGVVRQRVWAVLRAALDKGDDVGAWGEGRAVAWRRKRLRAAPSRG